MTTRWISCILILLALCSVTSGKVYQKCPLARALDSLQISSRSFISNWVCLINAESGADTSKKTVINDQRSCYGIFQISKPWCSEGRKGGDCNMQCEDFLNDDLTDDVECAKIIFNRGGGFAAWKGWRCVQAVSLTAVLLMLLCCAAPGYGKIYSKCELAKQLTANGISRTYQGHWICLAMHESGLNSTKVVALPNLSSNYGIFQINSKDWCREGRKGGKCNMKYLATDDVTRAIQCSKIIQQQKGFNEWVLWQKKCKGKDLPDISNCNATG
uniref:lysozyme n=1 Tax=Anopheles albimanus TaxID=7167 RepID=A0A182FGV9_ANOAL